MTDDSESKRTELFHKMINKNRYRILNSMENAPKVIRRLHQMGVLKNEELERLKHMPSLWTQKQQLLNLILQKDFEIMENLIRVLDQTNNQGLEVLFDFHRERILKEYPKSEAQNKNQLKDQIATDNLNKIGSGDDDDDIPKSDLDELPGEKDHLSIPMKPIKYSTVIDRKARRCQKCSFLKLFRAAAEGNVDFLKKLLDSGHFERLEPCKDCFKKTRGQTLLHAAVLAKNSTDVIECLELLVQKLCGDVTDGRIGIGVGIGIFGEDPTRNLFNKQDEEGQTPIHLAAENERSKVVEKLYHDYSCDILIKNKRGQTALDLINQNTPKVTWDILNQETLALAKNNDSLDGNFTLEIDFGRIIGYPLILNEKDYINNAGQNYIEMRTLTKLVEGNNPTAYYSLLSHVMVKTFLDLKWKKMRPFLFSYMSLKVALYIWYTFFVVNVFLAKCPISAETRFFERDVSLEKGGDRTIWTYLVGGWEAAVQGLTGFYDSSISPSSHDKRIGLCSYNPEMTWQPLVFFTLGILLLVKDFIQAVILSNVQSKRQKLLMAYWASWEDRFQVVFNLLMILIGTLAFRTTIPHYYYSYASLSIVVVWALIFMEGGYLLGQGMYVQLLGKIIKRFVTLMLNYLCWIISFSIALSILFPHDQPFETLSKSFLRVITMMSGELNYENTFYGHQSNGNLNGTETHGGPVSSIVFTAHVIYISIALLLTIIMSNALIGLVCSDVRELHERSEVLLRSIKVSKMYTMEVTLLKLRRLCPCLGRVLNIFVIHPKDIWHMNGDGMPTGDGMVVKVSIKDIPRKLQQEIREFAVKPEDYKYKGINEI